MEKFLAIVIVYVFELLISFTFFNKNYDRRQKSALLVLLIGLTLFIPGALVFNFVDSVIVNLIVSLIINVIFSLICFDISVKSSVLQSILLDAIMFATESAAIFFLSLVLKIPTSLYKSNVYIYIIVALICKLLYFAVSQILAFIIKRGNIKNSDKKHFIPLFIFPVLTTASLIVFLYIALKTDLSSQYQIAITVISVLYIFACIFIFIYYQTLSDNEIKINELESERRFYKLNTAYLDVLQHQNDELQMLFHDTKHHYLALSSFSDITEVKDYIKKIYPDLESKNAIKISNNKMLDLILNKYIVFCNKNSIKFDYEVKTANLEYIDDSELLIILNNILDNAVEAASVSKEKVVEFSLRNINNMDLLSVINSCDNPPKHNGNNLLTTKLNSTNHGFGTRIIKKHAEMNNGKYEWFYDKDECKFHLTILFQKQK